MNTQNTNFTHSGYAPAPADPSAFATAHRLLRGRYFWAITLGVVLAIIGVAAGFLGSAPVYRSVGIIRVQPAAPRILYPSEDVTNLHLFEAFIESQVSMVASREVVDAAISTPQWREAQLRSSLPEGTEKAAASTWALTDALASQPQNISLVEFVRNLEIEHPRGTELIEVRYTDADPRVAQTAVSSVIQAYMKLHVESEVQEHAAKIEVLNQARAEVLAKLDSIHRRIDTIAGDLGPDGLNQLYLLKLQDAARFETQMKEAAETGQLRSREEALSRLHQAALAESEALGERKSEIESLQMQAATARLRLTDIANRLEQFQIESQARSRINVVSHGDLPIEPYANRQIKLGAVGGLAGLGLGVGMVMLVGMLDVRLHNSEDTRELEGTATPLGVLPRLPKRMNNTTKAELGAHCVHQVRNVLQGWAHEHAGPAIAFTSPTSGDGKTSLVLALGLSYAHSKHRTLMIDCDLIGAGLSLRMGISQTPKLAWALRQTEMLDAQQIQEIPKDIVENDELLAKYLLKHEMLSQQELADLRIAQERGSMGVIDAIDGAPLEACISPTQVKNLDILPAGAAQPHHVSRLSRSALGEILDQVRGQYEIILIDTGPIPGSVEATIAAAEADGSVLIVRNHAKKPMVQRSLAQLASLGASTALIYNQAEEEDVETSATQSRIAQARTSMRESWSLRRKRRKFVRMGLRQSAVLGPIASAVAACSRAIGRQPSRTS